MLQEDTTNNNYSGYPESHDQDPQHSHDVPLLAQHDGESTINTQVNNNYNNLPPLSSLPPQQFSSLPPQQYSSPPQQFSSLPPEQYSSQQYPQQYSQYPTSQQQYPQYPQQYAAQPQYPPQPVVYQQQGEYVQQGIKPGSRLGTYALVTFIIGFFIFFVDIISISISFYMANKNYFDATTRYRVMTSGSAELLAWFSVVIYGLANTTCVSYVACSYNYSIFLWLTLVLCGIMRMYYTYRGREPTTQMQPQMINPDQPIVVQQN